MIDQKEEDEVFTTSRGRKTGLVKVYRVPTGVLDSNFFGCRFVEPTIMTEEKVRVVN